MTETPTRTAEIVTFRLRPGTDPSAFVAAAQALEPLLRASGGVIARTLSQADDGIWTDHILWRSLATAKATAAQMMTDPAAAPMMQMIDPDHVHMSHTQVMYQQE